MTRSIMFESLTILIALIMSNQSLIANPADSKMNPLPQEKKEVGSPPLKGKTTTKKSLKMIQQEAKTLFESKNYKAAESTLLPHQDSLSEESLYLLAAIYQKLDEPLKEKSTLEQLTMTYPKSSRGFAQLGSYYFKESTLSKKKDEILSKTQSAFEAFRKAIELEPRRRINYEKFAKALDYHKYFYELRVLSEDMIKKFGESASLLSQLCRLNAQENYFKVGKKYCLAALEADSTLVEPYIYLALIENNQERFDAVEKIFKKGKAKFPRSELLLSNYAEFLRQQKNMVGSEKNYQEATLHAPESFRAQMGLAKTSFALKHFDTALKALQEGCKIQPHSVYNQLKFFKDYLRLSKIQDFEAKYLSALNECQSQTANHEKFNLTPEEMTTPFGRFSRLKLND